MGLMGMIGLMGLIVNFQFSIFNYILYSSPAFIFRNMFTEK